MTNQASQQLIPTLFANTYQDQIYQALVFGDVANTEFTNKITSDSAGDTVTIPIDPDITVQSWAGGTLASTQKLMPSNTKIKVNNGLQARFYWNAVDEIQMKKDPEWAKKRVKKVNYGMANNIDQAYAQLYTEAGMKIVKTDGTTAVAITSSNAFQLIVEAQRRLKQNLGAQLDNYELFMIASPSFWANVIVDNRPFYTKEAREEGYKNGKIGKMIAGFETYETNNGYSSGTDYEYLYFGVKKQCLAGAIQKNIELMSNVPDAEVYTEYKGAGLFGVGCYDSRKFGVAKISTGAVISLT